MAHVTRKSSSKKLKNATSVVSNQTSRPKRILRTHEKNKPTPSISSEKVQKRVLRRESLTGQKKTINKKELCTDDTTKAKKSIIKDKKVKEATTKNKKVKEATTNNKNVKEAAINTKKAKERSTKNNKVKEPKSNKPETNLLKPLKVKKNQTRISATKLLDVKTSQKSGNENELNIDKILSANKESITFINQMMSEKSGQFLLVGPDRSLLNLIKNHISKSKMYKPVQVSKEKDDDPNGKLFFINLKNTTSVEYQSVLYYYLELPLKYNCFVCLISTSSRCLTFFEKRIRSRFKNKIVFVPYLNLENTESSYTLNNLSNKLQIDKYFGSKYEDFSLRFLLELLEPTHLVIILIAYYQKLTMNDSYTQFKQVTINTSEIKKVNPLRVFYSLYDLLEMEIINQTGKLIVDIGEVQEFISSSSPNYIKKLMWSMKNDSR